MFFLDNFFENKLSHICNLQLITNWTITISDPKNLQLRINWTVTTSALEIYNLERIIQIEQLQHQTLEQICIRQQ